MIDQKEDFYILEKNDSHQTIQEMIFLLCTKTDKIIGVSMKCNDDSIISYPQDTSTFEKYEKTEKLIKFELSQDSKLKRIETHRDP